jgi:hypothetical protein
MQINGLNANPYMDGRLTRPADSGFRPITSDDLTLSGIMRRIAEINLGSKLDIQA